MFKKMRNLYMLAVLCAFSMHVHADSGLFDREVVTNATRYPDYLK